MWGDVINMKIGIHHRAAGFSQHWVKYCELNNIEYKIVNAFDSDIVEQLKDCDAFMWHHHHADYKDAIAAKKILFSLEHAGVIVYPDFKTGWHFDDKVAQKYLLEAVGAPLVSSYIFYDKKKAENWAREASYPKVFKLKGGAGSSNVRLVESRTDALKLIKKAFGPGFSQFDRYNYLKDRFNKFRIGSDTLLGLMKGVARLFLVPDFAKHQPPERGYVYFQDFIPNNKFDTRVVVVAGEKAVAETRFVRKNDFRASGSGRFSYEGVREDIVAISFKVARVLDMQSVAFDFVIDERDQPLIVEISYGFGTEGISRAPGFWDSSLKWHKGDVTLEKWILESVVRKIKRK